MCNPLLITLGAAGAQAYGQKRSADAAQNAQFTKMHFDNARQNQEFISEMNRQNSDFASERKAANDSLRLRALDLQRQADLSRQADEITSQRLAAQEQEFQDQQRAVDEATNPIKEIGDALVNQAAIEGAQSELQSAIDESAAAGDQEVGSTDQEFGRVSQDYQSGAQTAKQQSIDKAKLRAKRVGTGVGISSLQRDNAESISDAGLTANLTRAKAARDLNFANQQAALGEANLSRQERLNGLLSSIEQGRIDSDLQLATKRNQIDNALAPEPVRLIDPTNRSAQLYSLLGGLASAYAGSGALDGVNLFGGKAANTTVNANEGFINRFAGYV